MFIFFLSPAAAAVALKFDFYANKNHRKEEIEKEGEDMKIGVLEMTIESFYLRKQ